MDQQSITVHYQRMEEWLKDRKSVLGKKYKKEFAHLLELAPKLEQLVRYDIPAQHKQMKKMSSTLDDSYRAIEEAAKMAQILEEKRERLLEEYGLLKDCTFSDEELDVAIDKRIALSRAFLQTALKQFILGTHFLSFREVYGRVLVECSMGMYGADAFSLHFPWLERVHEDFLCNLNVDTEQPVETEVESEKKEGMASCSIDWGDINPPDPIDMHAAVEIKWDEVSGENLPGDCGFTDDDNDDGMYGGSGDKLLERIKGTPIDISDAVHRQHILTELQGLQCFASERLLMDDNSLVECADVVNILEGKLTTSTEAAFVRMKTSPTLRLSLLDEIRRLQRGITATVMRRSSSEARLQQTQEELQRLEPQLDALLKTAQACRDECFVELSKMFPGRTVVIVGDINKYL